MEILNIFNIGSRLTVIESVVQSADSGLESADYNTDSNANPAKVSMWVWAFKMVFV